MDDDQPISRKRKIDNRTDLDLISDLPLHIIHPILALLPIRDAVRTCTLSSQWRYNWATLPHLVFDNLYVDKSKQVSIECLKNMVTNALLLHQGPIQSFKLSAMLNSCPETDRWLLCLSMNEIRELFLRVSHFDIRAWFRVHSSLYSCRNLTHLELYRCEVPPPPQTFKGFSCLRSLVLWRVRAAFDVVESLVANSPLLENFTCHQSAGAELRIRAPNLKCLELSSDFKEIRLYAPLAEKVSVTMFNDDFTAEQQSSVCNYIKFLGGLTNLERFTVYDLHFTKYLSIGIESYDRSLVFHHLKSIALHNLSFADKKKVAVVGHLIMGAPNLHEFIFSVSPPPNTSEAPPMALSYSDFGWAHDFTINKLRVVEVIVGGHRSEMEFIKILLTSSTVLETMTLHFNRLGADAISNLMIELLSYCRASPNAKILPKRRPSLP